MRPNVSQSYRTHQSGACILTDEISPASEASTSQTTARVKHTPTTREVDRSALARASASAAAVPSPNNPLDIDQMKANSAATDSKKVPSKRLTAKSIRWRPPLWLRSQLHAAPRPTRVIGARLR